MQQAAVGSGRQASGAVKQGRQNWCGQGKQAGTKQGGLQGEDRSKKGMNKWTSEPKTGWDPVMIHCFLYAKALPIVLPLEDDHG